MVSRLELLSYPRTVFVGIPTYPVGTTIGGTWFLAYNSRLLPILDLMYSDGGLRKDRTDQALVEKVTSFTCSGRTAPALRTPLPNRVRAEVPLNHTIDESSRRNVEVRRSSFDIVQDSLCSFDYLLQWNRSGMTTIFAECERVRRKLLVGTGESTENHTTH